MKETMNKDPMSPFCEALMDATTPVGQLRQDCDTALVICTDGKEVAVRQCGNYPDAVRMIYSKMKADDKFAELIMEASVYYSRYLNRKSLHQLFKEDTPITQPSN